MVSSILVEFLSAAAADESIAASQIYRSMPTQQDPNAGSSQFAECQSQEVPILNSGAFLTATPKLHN